MPILKFIRGPWDGQCIRSEIPPGIVTLCWMGEPAFVAATQPKRTASVARDAWESYYLPVDDLHSDTINYEWQNLQ